MMHILIVTFELHGLSDDAYRRHSAEVAPAFAAVPGLLSKLWLADPSTNTYGGVYLWDSPAALERYLDGPLFGALRTNPLLANVRARAFDTLDAANALTAGPLGAAAAREP